MESESSREPMPGVAGAKPGQAEGRVPEEGVHPEFALRTSSASLAAALGTREQLTARFPAEDGGRSLATMAQSDLDAALQLLADRAQYITGANGAAIALRRSGRNDMQCRASTGSNAPELGALLSTEFGLSGESVRTRRALRCDDAERDARVNHEVCRQLGIASVVVMPVVNEEEVLGVFELFSGKAHAFGERDLSALQRLSEMVETAVKLAQVTETLPERLRIAESRVSEAAISGAAEAAQAAPESKMDAKADVETDIETEVEADAVFEGEVETEVPSETLGAGAAAAPMTEAASARVEPAVVQAEQPLVARTPLKPLFWSAGASASAAEVQDSAQSDEGVSDQNHVPAVLRQLKKCEVCGFPITTGRSLCVECEEKRWRGQLRRPPVGAPLASPAPVKLTPRPTVASPSSGAAAALAPTRETETAPPAEPELKINKSKDLAEASPSVGTLSVVPAQNDAPVVSAEKAAANAVPGASAASPELVLSAGLQPSQSWLAANKYILGALLVVAGIVVGILLLR